MKQTKPPEEWEKKLLDLKCVNYNLYLGVDGGELAVSFDEGVKELKDFIKSLLAKQRKEMIEKIEKTKKTQDEIAMMVLKDIGRCLTGTNWYNKAIDDVLEKLKKI